MTAAVALTLPRRMVRLPVDEFGRVVPFFVAWVDGKPDHRIMDGEKLNAAIRARLCLLCGQPLGARGTFAIGPMCGVNRLSAEAPHHLDCATYSVQACPFLVNPDRRRRESRMPEGITDPGGEMIRRNPGVTLLWTTKRWALELDSGGVLHRLGEPESVSWWAEGRPATRAEVLASIESGLPALQELADADGPLAVVRLGAMTAALLALVPA